jgi:DNA mismatch repair ATPase MutL
LFEKSLPVRYHEFTRTFKKELKVLSAQVYELAIINPSITFELLVDGRCSISPISGCLTPYDVYKRLINGPELIEFSSSSDLSFKVTGWITPPVPTPWSLAASAGSSGGQFFFLNQRPINPIKKLVRGVTRLYTKFEIKKVSFIFCLSVPENKNYFDINVAVDKREVVLCNGLEDKIVDQVLEDIEELFNTYTGKDEAVPASAPTPKRVLITPSRKRALEAVSAPSPRVVERNVEDDVVVPAVEEEALAVREEPEEEEEVIEQNETEELSNYQILPFSESVPAISLSFPKELFRSMSIIGQFNNGFIIARLDTVPGRVPELFLIDQHAANEKYLFEEYFRNIKVNYQRLIIPIKIRAPPWIEQVVQEYSKELAANGFISEIGVDNEGNRCIQVNSLPTLSGIGFNRSAALTVKDFMEITEALHEGTVAPRGNGEDVLFLLKSLSSVRAHMASKACRTAIMVGDPLSSMKMTEIVHALSSLDQPWNCPHGRPTMKHLLSLDELQQFN